MIRGIIYKYTSPSGKVYIGQTINEKDRRKHSRKRVALSSAKWGASKLDEDIVLTTCIYKDVEVHKRTA